MFALLSSVRAIGPNNRPLPHQARLIIQNIHRDVLSSQKKHPTNRALVERHLSTSLYSSMAILAEFCQKKELDETLQLFGSTYHPVILPNVLSHVLKQQDLATAVWMIDQLNYQPSECLFRETKRIGFPAQYGPLIQELLEKKV